jgi:hypothetical protein
MQLSMKARRSNRLMFLRGLFGAVEPRGGGAHADLVAQFLAPEALRPQSLTASPDLLPSIRATLRPSHYENRPSHCHQVAHFAALSPAR